MTIECLSVSAQWVEDKRIPEGWTPHISSLALTNSEEERQNKTEAGVAVPTTEGADITHVFRINRDVAEFFMWGIH
jgi:hypothetical protein